jgi:hypothetical protein
MVRVRMKSGFDPRKAHEDGDTLPEQANVYVPPRPLAQISEHRTIDVKAIRIAAELDPRQAKTQLRLSAPPPRQRGLPLFIVGSAIVLGLFGVVIYMAFARPAPLPLVTSDAPAPAAESAVATSAVTATAAPTTTGTPMTASAQSASTEAVRTGAAPSAPASAAPATLQRVKPAARRPAPHKAKVSREPWLE